MLHNLPGRSTHQDGKPLPTRPYSHCERMRVRQRPGQARSTRPLRRCRPPWPTRQTRPTRPRLRCRLTAAGQADSSGDPPPPGRGSSAGRMPDIGHGSPEEGNGRLPPNNSSFAMEGYKQMCPTTAQNTRIHRRIVEQNETTCLNRFVLFRLRKHFLKEKCRGRKCYMITPNLSVLPLSRLSAGCFVLGGRSHLPITSSPALRRGHHRGHSILTLEPTSSSWMLQNYDLSRLSPTVCQLPHLRTRRPPPHAQPPNPPAIRRTPRPTVPPLPSRPPAGLVAPPTRPGTHPRRPAAL